jgi:hypothetical protein
MIDRWIKEKDYLSLAKYLKDNNSIGSSIIEFSKLTGQPIRNANDIATWEYYGGSSNDLEILEVIANWDTSDDFYINLARTKKP